MPVSNYLSVEMVMSLCIPLFLGMLLLLGSSTFDPEKQQEEPLMEIQRIEGEKRCF